MPMDPDRHQLITELLQRTRELPTAARRAFLERECASDPELLDEVWRQLAQEDDEPATEASCTEAPPADEAPTVEAATEVRRDRSTAEPSSIPAGTCIGPYRTVRLLGRGGMGVVYLARQESPIRRDVALKLIQVGMNTREVVARFEAERQALALMDHPNIAHVFDAGATDDGRPYFAMEYAAGATISQFCDEHELPVRRRLELFLSVCEAVHHAHQKGVIHRDLKPSNILVTVIDGKPVPKVIDFGVAKATSQRLTERTLYTQQGQLVGTPAYMSPEQATMGGQDIDTTSDVYSLGVILYELLVGAPPFDRERLRQGGWVEVERIIRHEDPPTPSTKLRNMGEAAQEVAERRHTAIPALKRQVRGDLDWITMRAMEKDRSRRYQAVSALITDIRRYFNSEAVLACPPSTTYRLKKMVQRNKELATAVALVFVALAGGLVVSTTMYVRAEAARQTAVQQTQKAGRINDFLQNMLRSVDPTELGREVTVREVLDEAAGLIETDLANEPEVQAAVQSTIGNTYMALGFFDAAESHLRASLATREAILGETDPEVASSLNDLAALFKGHGEPHMAEPLFRRALALDQRAFGPDHPTVATSLSNLALALKDQGHYAEAESLCLQALAIRRVHLQDDDPEIAVSLNNLAALLQDQGKYDQAEPLMREALTKRRALYDGDHPDIATSLNNLGTLLQAQGNCAEAAPLLQDALAMTKSLYGEDHPRVAASVGNLAIVLEYLGRYEEAEPLYREALALYRAILGDTHPYVAYGMNNLAILLHNVGQDEEAEELHWEALLMRRQLLGDDHPSVASSLCNLAALLHDQGRLDEAESLYREAMAIRKERMDDTHPLVASTLLGLGSLLTDKGEAATAETMLRECEEIRLETQGPDSWQVASVQNALGHCMAAQARYAEAESLLLSSAPILLESNAVPLQRKQQAIQRVIALYDAWDRPEEAAAYRSELAKLARSDS